MKVLHIINGLPRSGAEMALVRLAVAQKALGDDVSVIALLPDGVLKDELVEAGVAVTTLDLKPNTSLPKQLVGLARAIRSVRPDVVHTWLYHANLVGGTVSRMVRPRTPVVWGIHHSYLKRESSKRTTRLVSRALAGISRLVPTRIIYCAETSRSAHEDAGYARSRGVVIPNGVDTSVFTPDADARRAIRGEIGLAEDDFVVGTVARWHPDKDIATLVRAAAIAMRDRDDMRLVLVGSGLDTSNADLQRVVDDSGLGRKVLALGPRSDIAHVLNAFDVFALSSITEAFPVSVIEAMATGRPCVSTDVGDARTMIGRSGRVVPVRDAEAMATAILDLFELEPKLRHVVEQAARQRVENDFRLEHIVARHRSLYRELTGAD